MTLHLKTIRLLKALSKQLAAMNCSAVHAVSWVEPKSDTTKRRVHEIDALVKELRSAGEGTTAAVSDAQVFIMADVHADAMKLFSGSDRKMEAMRAALRSAGIRLVTDGPTAKKRKSLSAERTMRIVALCNEIKDAAKRRETKSGGTLLCAEAAEKILQELRQSAKGEP